MLPGLCVIETTCCRDFSKTSSNCISDTVSCAGVPPPHDRGRFSGQTRKRQRAINARPSDGEVDQEEDGTEDEERVKAMVSFQEVRWLNGPPDRGEEDMEEQQERQRRTLAALTGMSRVSKETKLRLRVIFLDDSERSFEVEVSFASVY